MSSTALLFFGISHPRNARPTGRCARYALGCLPEAPHSVTPKGPHSVTTQAAAAPRVCGPHDMGASVLTYSIAAPTEAPARTHASSAPPLPPPRPDAISSPAGTARFRRGKTRSESQRSRQDRRDRQQKANTTRRHTLSAEKESRI